MRGSFKAAGAVLGVVLGVAVPLTCHFEGLSFEATCALGILVGAICWWVSGTLPEYVTALVMSVLFIAVAGVPTDVVFSTFAGSTWWLLLAAFGLGLGMQKSGLLRRMALGILRVFPRTFKAQAAGLVAAGTLVGPLIPSLSAKATMLAPLAMGVSDSMGYERKGTQANGLFLAMFTGIRTVGPAVISASIIGYGIVALLPEDVQQQFDMVHWFIAMLPWFVVVMLLNYAAIVAIYAPRGEGLSRGKARQERASSGGKASDIAAADGRSNASNGARESACACSDADGGMREETAGEGEDPAEKSASGGPMSRHEKQMAAIMTACVALWVLEPVTGIEAHVVALGALVLMLACGIVSKSDFRSGIAWDSLVFIGVVLGLAQVFSYLGIDTWIVGLCQPVFASLSANPYVFVAGIGIITVLLRFVIVSEMAYLNLFMAFMVPLAVSLGINPWVVGVTVYAMVNPWFALYQNPIYLSAYYAVDGKMANHASLAKYCAVYLAICLVGLMVSVPYWQSMGLL